MFSCPSDILRNACSTGERVFWNLALTEQAKTVTLIHLRKTAMPEARVEAALRNALESEAELTESDGADERLLTLLGLRGSRKAQASKAKTDEPSPSPKQQDRPWKRSPGRDGESRYKCGAIKSFCHDRFLPSLLPHRSH